MINIIKADFYRLFRSKGFLITQLILIGFITLGVFFEKLRSSGITVGESIPIHESVKSFSWTGVATLQSLSTMSSYLIYFCLPLFTMTVGYDFSRHTLKNLLTSGISRNKFIISKYLVFIVMTLMQFVYFYGTAFIVASIKNGIGILDLGFLQELSKTLGIQFACIQGVFVIALFVLVLSFSNVMTVFTVIVLPVTLTILSLFLDKIKWLKYLAFQNNMDMAWRDSMPETYWSYVFFTTALVFLVFFIASLIVFKKKDL